MYFYPDKYETTLRRDSSMPSFDFMNRMKEEGVLYYSLISEISVDDIIFDIRFLKITEKTFCPSKKNGFILKATCSSLYGYHAFMYENQSILTVNPTLSYMLDDYISFKEDILT
jgi:hypothetical protein